VIESLGPWLIAELLLLGVVVGFLAGLLGIGGGMFMVPFLTFMLGARGVDADLAVKMAIATAMATIVFTSISSVRAHHARGAVQWPLVRSLAPGIVAGGRHLGLIFGAFVVFSAWRMLRRAQPKAQRALPGPAGLFSAGAGIGFASGLVGAGGAFLSVPFMTWCGVAMHGAVASAAALGFPIAAANVLGYVASGLGVAGRPPASLGHIWLPALALIAGASVLLAPLGARAAHALPVRRLQGAFAALLLALGGWMIWNGLR
jgi:uncharacterized protein